MSHLLESLQKPRQPRLWSGDEEGNRDLPDVSLRDFDMVSVLVFFIERVGCSFITHMAGIGDSVEQVQTVHNIFFCYIKLIIPTVHGSEEGS